MKNITEGTEVPLTMTRVIKMLKMEEAVFGKKRESSTQNNDPDSPPAIDLNPELAAFEAALSQSIEAVGDEAAKRNFNLILDKKLDEYRQRREDAASDPGSRAFKDSFYKLIIGNHLRTFGSVKLEDAYNLIAETVGIDNIDGLIFNNAWKVIKSYAEGRASQVVKGTGFGK